MVHDVIHERFPRHGRAYYEERNRQVRRGLAAFKSPHSLDAATAAKYFALVDDLGAGLDYLGQSQEAAGLLREKLKAQQTAGLKGKDLYTTYANLGTFLSHAYSRAALRGDREARSRVAEGLDFVRESIEANPQAHFGREIWQVVLVEFLDSAIDQPNLLATYDFVGDRLDAPVDAASARPYYETYIILQVPLSAGWSGESIRSEITRIGAEADWKEAVHSRHIEPVAFDEPVLGIIGIWRLGSGANPHFALGLGEIMLRVGQRYIAWCAFERAVTLEDRFWPDLVARQKFVSHCRARQRLIEEQIPSSDRSQLRRRFQGELEFGKAYQRAYQEFEADRITAKVPLDDPHFYDAFHERHGPIASPVGGADRVLVAPRPPYSERIPYSGMVLGAGVSAFGTAWLLRKLAQRRARPANHLAPGEVES